MWVEELKLENIKCFQQINLRFAEGESPYPWITFLGENGCGKSTALQALALLLAGPEGAQKLLPRPVGWLHDELKPGDTPKFGVISTRIHQGENDPGKFGAERVTRAFGYSFFLTGTEPTFIRNKPYSEPTIVENPDKRLSWLRQNALTSTGKGWFAVGYGAFRRLTRDPQIIVPSLEPQARFTNFSTQFNEEQPLSAFERWMVYLDYRIAKGGDSDEALRQKEIGTAAINKVLPEGVEFDQVTAEGRVYFKIGGINVPTISLSDGYRSILALTGDLIWRMLLAFPDSTNPLHEEGIALIDELDIHLHPIWQRQIAGSLRGLFPNIQFLVATHSPLIAAGAGSDALTYRFGLRNGVSMVERVDNLSAMSVDRILQSDAFNRVSPFSPETQAKIEKFDSYNHKRNRRPEEEQEYQQLLDFMEEARPYGGPPAPGTIDARIERYLEQAVK